MRYEPTLINKIKRLRKLGRSYPEIGKKLGIGKSSVAYHARKINIDQRYLQRWKDRRKTSKMVSSRNWKKAYLKVRGKFEKISKRDLRLIGSMLYWAEGSKKDFSFSNTDANMVTLFLRSIRKGFDVKNSDIKISIRVYEDLNVHECLKYWSVITDISLTKKTSVNILKGSKRGKLKYGMCRIRIKKGGQLFKEIFSIVKIISKNNAPIVQWIEQGRPKP